MNLLIVQWNAYTYRDILSTLKQMGIHYHTETYYFKDKNEDPFFLAWFAGKISEGSYDAVFSVNYFPLIAESCHQRQIKYLSWSYDCPLNVPDIEQTLGYETNYVFLFDRVQAFSYHKKGFNQVYHLPLAVNVERLNKIHATDEELAYYSSDISFVGSLYESTYPTLCAPLSDYTKGYLDALMEMQFPLYGQFLFDQIITDRLINNINTEYRNSNTNILLNREQLIYSLSTYVTHKERLALLKLLSEQHQIHLYSRQKHPMLSPDMCRNPVSYMEDMPKVFKHSKINLNITVKNTQSGIPLRVMDILGCGGFLLSNYQPELAEFFVPNEDFVYYEDISDALDKASFYLENDNIRTQIAQNGYEKVKEYFNYPRQLRQLFDVSGL